MKTASLCAMAFIAASLSSPVTAADHLDTPTVIADPAADIGDLYAWVSPDGRRLNLVMGIVGKRFSDQVAYVFHVDSGRHFGRTSRTTTIQCRFDVDAVARCDAAGDHAAGVADVSAGIESQRRLFRIFAGLRDDPFANNVRGTRQAYEVVERALKVGVARDAAGCPGLGYAVAGDLRERWRHTDGGPARNFLAGWTTGALVVSIDLRALEGGGPLLAVWAGTYAIDANTGGPAWESRLDRMGRTLTGNALVGLFDAEENANRRKEQYNRAARQDWPAFVPDIQKSLALYDAFDGKCGNQWLASPETTAGRYAALARLLADDRLWVDTRRRQCTRYMAVERAGKARSPDCGGRTPAGGRGRRVPRAARERNRVGYGRRRPAGRQGAFVRRLSLPGSTVTTGIRRLPGIVLALACACATTAAQARPPTIAGDIAVANLDHLLAQPGESAGRIERLLARSRFLGDYDALDLAVALAERLTPDDEGLLLRARARASVHRFAAALGDLRAAEQAGADATAVGRQRAVILVATGRAPDALAWLERDVALHPDHASHSALASAYAEAGRYREADREYRRALASLDTTSPFPYAWLHFAIGVMWTEQAGDARRGEAEYDQALAYLPQFVAANLHKAELELGRGDLPSAQARLAPIARSTHEPGALAVLAEIERHAGSEAAASQDIALAEQRYRALLDRQPLAFVDHAAEFYLGAGANAELAWRLALRNLDNRKTPRAFAIAMRAAVASGRDACGLIAQMTEAFHAAASSSTRVEWERRAGTGIMTACSADQSAVRKAIRAGDRPTRKPAGL